MCNVMVSSLDAVALYPSLEIGKCSKIVADRVDKSGVKIEGVSYKWAAKYLALVLSDEEIRVAKLGEVVPKKRGGRQGRRTFKEEARNG